jgi:tetratricopeptide (TPR) repeat protein
LTAISAQFNQLFNKSLLAESKQLVRSAMAIASRANSYYHLSRLFFMASGVYYEEGSYENAIRYVNKALQLSVSLGLTEEVPELTTRLAMNCRNMGLYGNAIKYLERAQSTWVSKLDATKWAVLLSFGWDLHMEVNDKQVEEFRKRNEQFMADFEGKHWRGYYWYNTGTYHYNRCELDRALNAMKTSKRLYLEGGVTDDAFRSGVQESSILIELGRFHEAKLVLTSLDRLRKGLESKNRQGEYHALRLAFHYYTRSNHRTLGRYIANCEEAARDVKEIPVLLAMETMMFRAKARLGDLQGAKRVFRARLGKIKKILSNMPDVKYASNFLSKRDEQLLMREFKLINK